MKRKSFETYEILIWVVRRVRAGRFAQGPTSGRRPLASAADLGVSRSKMIKSIATIFAMGILVISCSRGVSHVQTRPLPSRNPTTFSFPLPLEQVRTGALRIFSIEHQTEHPVFRRSPSVVPLESVLAAECFTNPVFARALFRDRENANDIYLHSFHTPFVVSSVYCGRDGGLPFIAAFHLHLTASGPNTLVTVTACDAEVVNGQKFGFGSCGPGYAWVYEPVTPTTVEEYSILRYLGTNLGVTNMPDVILPAR
jgi:hypothetical protein